MPNLTHMTHIEDQVSYPVGESRIYAEIEDRSFWFQHRNALIAALAMKWAPGAAFCDVGGGNGVVAAALQAQGREVILIEPGRAACACARDVRGISTVHEGTLEDAGIEQHPLLGAFDVVEHIEDSVGFLRTMRENTLPGGTVLIAVPAFQWLWSNEDSDVGHFRRYTRRSIRRELEEAGWSVQQTSCFFSLLVLPIALLRSLPWRLGVRKSREDGAATDAARIQREHAGGSEGLAKLAQCAFRWEIPWISRGRSLPIGSSVIAIAKNPTT